MKKSRSFLFIAAAMLAAMPAIAAEPSPSECAAAATDARASARILEDLKGALAVSPLAGIPLPAELVAAAEHLDKAGSAFILAMGRYIAALDVAADALEKCATGRP